MIARQLGPCVAAGCVLLAVIVATPAPTEPRATGAATVRPAVAQDLSPPLAASLPDPCGPEPRPVTAGAEEQPPARPALTSGSVEQTEHGTKPPPEIVASFDGLGVGFEGPQGTATFRNPSDNSLAVGPDHIVQTVNSRMAVFTKKGAKFDTTGKVLYGPVPTGNVFKGFGDFGDLNNGDAVVRWYAGLFG